MCNELFVAVEGGKPRYATDNEYEAATNTAEVIQDLQQRITRQKGIINDIKRECDCKTFYVKKGHPFDSYVCGACGKMLGVD